MGEAGEGYEDFTGGRLEAGQRRREHGHGGCHLLLKDACSHGGCWSQSGCVSTSLCASWLPLLTLTAGGISDHTVYKPPSGPH